MVMMAGGGLTCGQRDRVLLHDFSSLASSSISFWVSLRVR